MLLVPMSCALHKRAHNVLKFLRWRNSGPDGAMAEHFTGVEFDCSEGGDGAIEQLIGVWNADRKGQGGSWSQPCFQWSWREWVRMWSDGEKEALLAGGSITVFGCRPIAGTRDPCPGMVGPV